MEQDLEVRQLAREINHFVCTRYPSAYDVLIVSVIDLSIACRPFTVRQSEWS